MGCRFRFVSARAALILSFAAAGTFPPTAAAGNEEIFGNGFEGFTLTVNNAFGWCSVSVNDGPFNSSPSAQYAFNEGVVVVLHATPLPGFVWGQWTGTDNDVGAGDPGVCASSICSTTATMSGNRSVLACCPISGQTTCQ